MHKVLIIDDDESMLETLASYISGNNYTVITALKGTEGVGLIKKERPDLVITDVRMPVVNGLDILKKAKDTADNLPVVMITAFDDNESIIKAMQLGAYDFLDKPIEKEKFNLVVKRALETKRLSEKLEVFDSSKTEFKKEDILNNLVGKSYAIKEIIKMVGRVSMNRMTVLIEGESGTGKEIISRIIHYSGITKDEPFVAVNSSAISGTLLESELFGHVKGSFTDAIRDKKGKFELAGSGTIFLDEISEFPLELQSKILRVIQEKEFERIGDEFPIPLNARIITATNKNLSDLVEQEKFREDLYYRLNVFKIRVPSLKERTEDIPVLVMHLLKKINDELHKNVFKVPYEVMEMLQKYEWVGNIRELENKLKEAVLLAGGNVLEKEYFTFPEIYEKANNKRDNMSMAEVEKEHITFILNKVKWDKSKAEKILKISRPTLNKKIQQYNITNT